MEDGLCAPTPRMTTDQMLQLILGRLERFPVERFVRMEAELQQLRQLLEDEIQNRKNLAQDLQRITKEFGDTLDKRIDRAFRDCREDRDVRLAHVGDQIRSITTKDNEERDVRVRVRIATLSAVFAFVISIVNAIIYVLFRR